MNFAKHSELEGKHAYLSASKYHWINYSDEKLEDSYSNFQSVMRGTRLHELAAEHIRLGIKMAKTKTTLNMYVNDAIGYKMTPEQVLYYSPNCFGTADAIFFRKDHLQIHDLKTGVTPAHMEQLEIYAALFCLEYGYKPSKITTELRIYQSDEIIHHTPEPDDINDIMDKIVRFDTLIERIKKGE